MRLALRRAVASSDALEAIELGLYVLVFALDNFATVAFLCGSDLVTNT